MDEQLEPLRQEILKLIQDTYEFKQGMSTEEHLVATFMTMLFTSIEECKNERV